MLLGIVFWHYRSGQNSVSAFWESLKLCFGGTGMFRKMFWHSGSGQNSVLAYQNWSKLVFIALQQ